MGLFAKLFEVEFDHDVCSIWKTEEVADALR